MKKSRSYTFLVLAVLSLLMIDIMAIIMVNAAESEYNQQVQDNANTIRTTVSDNIQEFQHSSGSEVDKLEKQLEEIQKKLSQRNDDAALDILYELDALRAQIANLKRTLNEDMENLQDDIEDDVDDLEDGFGELQAFVLGHGAFY